MSHHIDTQSVEGIFDYLKGKGVVFSAGWSAVTSLWVFKHDGDSFTSHDLLEGCRSMVRRTMVAEGERRAEYSR